MKKRIIDYFGKTANNFSKKIAMTDKDTKLTYSECEALAKNMAIKMYDRAIRKSPVAIYMEQGVNLGVAILSVLYTDNFYVVLDCDSPKERIEKILETLKPAAIICQNEDAWLEKIGNDKYQIDESEKPEIICFEDNKEKLNKQDLDKLKEMEKGMTLESPAYALFTSGSTGTPKGVLVTQGNVISYVKWFTKCFKIDETTEFGAQTPLYFSMSVSDFYGTIFKGGCYNVIPKEYFAFPAQLIAYMNERKINTIYWVPSALGIVSKWDLFKYAKLDYIKKVMFAGEAMPVKYLNYWRTHLPNVKYANLFGPTETTDICMYYKVDRDFQETESLPIGKACDNCQLIVIDIDTGKEVTDGMGELYVKSPFVAKGYFRNLEKTKECFVQNPLHNDYPDIVYKTGDLVMTNDRGEYLYLGRRDFQIKHMGYRIELGEIENVLNSVDDKIMTVCVFDVEKDQIVLVYEAKDDLNEQLMNMAAVKLPTYMQPERYVQMESLPINQNGKIDRKAIGKMVIF